MGYGLLDAALLAGHRIFGLCVTCSIVVLRYSLQLL
jgi:hypothetical protein